MPLFLARSYSRNIYSWYDNFKNYRRDADDVKYIESWNKFVSKGYTNPWKCILYSRSTITMMSKKWSDFTIRENLSRRKPCLYLKEKQHCEIRTVFILVQALRWMIMDETCIHHFPPESKLLSACTKVLSFDKLDFKRQCMTDNGWNMDPSVHFHIKFIDIRVENNQWISSQAQSMNLI